MNACMQLQIHIKAFHRTFISRYVVSQALYSQVRDCALKGGHKRPPWTQRYEICHPPQRLEACRGAKRHYETKKSCRTSRSNRVLFLHSAGWAPCIPWCSTMFPRTSQPTRERCSIHHPFQLLGCHGFRAEQRWLNDNGRHDSETWAKFLDESWWNPGRVGVWWGTLKWQDFYLLMIDDLYYIHSIL